MSLSNILQDTAEQVASTLSKNLKILATIYKKISIAQIAGSIYDKIIVDMTKVWYRCVLEQQPDHAFILDVGIGTGGEK